MASPTCRQCLLKELGKDDYFRSIYEYIDALPAEQKSDPDEYNRRLSICKACQHLMNGMCEVCGCFVEVRAAKKAQSCSLTQSRW